MSEHEERARAATLAGFAVPLEAEDRRSRLRLAIEVDLGGEPVKTVLVPKTLDLIGFLAGWTAGAPAAILLLAAPPRRRDSLRTALAPAIGDFPLAVEIVAALSSAWESR